MKSVKLDRCLGIGIGFKTPQIEIDLIHDRLKRLKEALK